MKIVVYPAVDAERFTSLQAAAPGAQWVNAATAALAEAAMPGADAFVGKITPAMLAWAAVSAFTHCAPGAAAWSEVNRSASTAG